MATSDAQGQTRVLVRSQSGAGPTTAAALAASGGTVSVDAGGALTLDGTVNVQSRTSSMHGAIKFNSTIDHVWLLQWASAQVAAIATLPISLPNDMSTAGGLTIELFGETVGSASAADAQDCFNILARFGVGNASAAGTTHPNFTTTPSWKGITVASGSVTTDTLSIQLTPQTHANQQLNLYNMRASYTKKTS